VFPLRPGDKTPQIAKSDGGRGFKDATTDVDKVRRWWSWWPKSNVGMPTGVLFDVLDVDVKPMGNGWASLTRLQRAGLLVGCVGITTTRNGGAHLYFPASGDKSHALPYLDFKAAGGYVVVPPSRVPADMPLGSGRYEWSEPVTDAPGSPLDWSKVSRLLRPSPVVPPTAVQSGSASGQLNGLLRFVDQAVEGERNNKLFWALCTALAAGLDPQPILDAARMKGLGDAEVDATYQSAWRTTGRAS
jgi:hypothetical protein